MAETYEERQKRIRDLRERIAIRLLERYPDVTLDMHQWGIDVIHYVASFSDGVRISTRKKAIGTAFPDLDGYFLTEAAARQAITRHLNAAQAKFKKCLKALNRLKQSLDFDVSYFVEGDTYGVEDHPIITFKLNGFDFTFVIER